MCYYNKLNAKVDRESSCLLLSKRFTKMQSNYIFTEFYKALFLSKNVLITLLCDGFIVILNVLTCNFKYGSYQ